MGAVAAACWGIRAAAPAPRIAQVADKLDAIEHAEKPHDVLFFGSSKIYSGIIPATFDRVMAEHGFPVRSYNLGVDGMGYPESGFLCEEALARRPGSVRWVFLEISSVRTHIPPLQKNTRRFGYWHDLPRTALVVGAIQTRRSTPHSRREEDSVELFRLHLSAFLRRSLNLGDGAEWIASGLGRAPELQGRDLLDPALRGYCAITNQMAGTELVNFRKALGTFDARIKRAESYTEEAMRAFAAEVSRHGANTVLIGTPNPEPNAPLFAANEGALSNPPIFNFGQPAQYPLLYQEDHHGDSTHLNHAGAEAFSVYLANRFAAHLRTLGSVKREGARTSAPRKSDRRG